MKKPPQDARSREGSLASGFGGKNGGGERQIVFERNLDVGRTALHAARSKAEGLDRMGFVGEAVESRLGERCPQYAETKHLRRLRAPKRIARLCTVHTAIVPKTLQRIGNGNGEKPADPIIGKLPLQAQRGVSAEARPHCVVHDDPVIRSDDVIEMRKCVANALRT